MGDAVRVAVVGPGAIGASFAAVVQQGGAAELVLCGRTAVPVITVRPDDAEPVVLDGGVRTDPASVPGPVDWVLLAVKTHQLDGAARWLDALCGPDTVVAVLQNGVEHRELVGPRVGRAHVLPAIVWCPAEATDRADVRLRARPRLVVPDEPAGYRLAELLRPGGAEITPEPDFTTALWRKLTVNAVAGLMVLAGRRAAMFRRPDVAELATALARECVAVGNAAGASLPPDTPEQVAAEMAAHPPDLGSSILFDREAGRPLEWDVRNGVVRRFGARHGIPTPISDVLVPLLAAASDG